MKYSSFPCAIHGTLWLNTILPLNLYTKKSVPTPRGVETEDYSFALPLYFVL
jgi:hypothetical protein